MLYVYFSTVLNVSKYTIYLANDTKNIFTLGAMGAYCTDSFSGMYFVVSFYKDMKRLPESIQIKEIKMNQIKCPHCGEVFTIDENDYESIVKQIRDHEYKEDLKEIEKRYSRELEQAKEMHQKELAQAISLAKAEAEKGMTDLLSSKSIEIEKLNAKVERQEAETMLRVSEAVKEKEEQINALVIKSQTAEEAFRQQIADKDEMIAYYKDFKTKQSTKMVGESLEQHCSYEFNKLRSTAFKNAYFEKDNDSKSGSKGDFIFRDFDDDGTEYISIMFEMKNENDTTATKHKNEHFFKELDKDRNEKKCEYAILVSMLEADNELYNEGIVDVSYKYDKMYVVRPQFFIPIITLLRDAARNSLQYRRELQVIQAQNMDYAKFESNMKDFQQAFGRNYELASRKFKDAIDDIDKTIKALEKTKADLLSSENNLRLANDKAQDLSIKKLTKGAPSVAKEFGL